MTTEGIQVLAPVSGRGSEILTDDALAFVASLHRAFDAERRRLLAARVERQAELDAGGRLAFLERTAEVRRSEWRVAMAPADLLDRRVEITGPVDRKMMINALNSGARVFMADFEDANSPTWDNVVQGQANLIDAVERTISLQANGKGYELLPTTATLLVRPRGWHLTDKHVLVDGAPISASLFDLGLFLFHCARRQLERGTGPYLYLPKLESHEEARLWNEVFCAAQDALGMPRGTIRATVLIETIPAAFEMDEILYELRDHASGLNAGRWDYIFSVIKKLGRDERFVLPDRSSVTMTVPFMRAYTELLVRTCHRRGAHAIGGMAAFIPNRRKPDVTEVALEKVREDKEREAGDGFDGTWVAHPDLVPVAAEEFDRVLGDRADQRDRLREEVSVSADDLLDVRVPGGRVTTAGLHANVEVALRYLESWLGGVGAAAINDLMEDTATAEIARSQVWQWIHHGVALEDGRTVSRELVGAVTAEEHARIADAMRAGRMATTRVDEARAILEEVTLADHLPEFLTPAA
ncbi:MAG TPA: malate synthase A, partial [Actinomycetota bacterium]|nr:malate synthase A [Actinomycetota bacterium]